MDKPRWRHRGFRQGRTPSNGVFSSSESIEAHRTSLSTVLLLQIVRVHTYTPRVWVCVREKEHACEREERERESERERAKRKKK